MVVVVAGALVGERGHRLCRHKHLNEKYRRPKDLESFAHELAIPTA
jgi:hypothetical protein